MFDQHIICREGFSNVTRDGEVIGVRFLARLPYYRGLGLSMVEDIAVTLNGEKPSRGRRSAWRCAAGSGRSTSWRASTTTGGTSVKRRPSRCSNPVACRPAGIA